MQVPPLRPDVRRPCAISGKYLTAQGPTAADCARPRDAGTDCELAWTVCVAPLSSLRLHHHGSALAVALGRTGALGPWCDYVPDLLPPSADLLGQISYKPLVDEHDRRSPFYYLADALNLLQVYARCN